MVKDNKLNTIKHTCIYKNSKFLSAFLSIHQQRGTNIKGINNNFLPFCINQNNKDVYDIYIHEEERREVNSPAYMHLYEKR